MKNKFLSKRDLENTLRHVKVISFVLSLTNRLKNIGIQDIVNLIDISMIIGKWYSYKIMISAIFKIFVIE